MPKANRKEFKTKVVTVRMSQGMYQQATEQANKKHMGIQEYIRYLLTREVDRTLGYLEEP